MSVIDTISAAELQRGRAHWSAESTIEKLTSWPEKRFNGAALTGARRDFEDSIHDGDLPGFNGAALTGARRVARALSGPVLADVASTGPRSLERGEAQGQ